MCFVTNLFRNVYSWFEKKTPPEIDLHVSLNLHELEAQLDVPTNRKCSDAEQSSLAEMLNHLSLY